MNMRHLFAARMRSVDGRSIASALTVAFAIVSFSGVAWANAIYRWQDAGGRLHFSNIPARMPSSAEPARLRELSIVRAPRPAGAAAPALAGRPGAEPWTGAVCAAADPSRLIDAISARLAASRSEGVTDSPLTLLVAGKPVSFAPDAVLEVRAATDSDATGAGEQAAVAYPGGLACPRTPPLERYAVAMTARDPSSPSGLCEDYRRASAEIDIALSRNESVARSFRVAAVRFESQAAGGNGFETPPWLVEAGAAQTAELAAEIEEFITELSVAREEIDRAARARDCW
jgi:hypothetical protein